MKILVVLPRFPFPLEKGDKLRAYNQIKSLAQKNEIHLFALSHTGVGEDALEEMRKYCKSICVARLNKLSGGLRMLRNFFSVRSLQLGYWSSSKARKMFRRYEARVCPDVVYAQMVRTAGYAALSRNPKVLDFQDALSMNMERSMSMHRGLHYFVLHYEFKMLRSLEYNACSTFDALTIISEIDSEAIPQHKNTVIDIVRNGVDFDYYRPVTMEKTNDIVFCGNMQYKPNIDASKYLIGEVMPIVWRTHPNAHVILAGATPKTAVRQLAGERVTVTGWVDDIRPYYAKSKVFVAPMRIGSGLQNKLLEAMSMGVPCVTTPLANDSLGATEGKEILVGRDAGQLAASIVRLLDDEGLRLSLSESASVFVKEHFSWDAAGNILEGVLKKAVQYHTSNEETEFED
ncbi:MAG: glycosyltransferase [Bacteroidales bacterium]|nr:glycosyltransferase [Bacteroidales bacterium]